MSVTRASLVNRLRHPTRGSAETQNTILCTSVTCADMREAAEKLDDFEYREAHLVNVLRDLLTCNLDHPPCEHFYNAVDVILAFTGENLA